MGGEGRVGLGGRFRFLERRQKALACDGERKRDGLKHHGGAATSRGGKEKQRSLKALTPSNPGHQRSLQEVLSEEDLPGNPEQWPAELWSSSSRL